MVMKEIKLKGSRGGEIIVRTTAFDEVGIIEKFPPELKQRSTSVYWLLGDTDKILESIRQLVEEHKKEKMKEVI